MTDLQYPILENVTDHSTIIINKSPFTIGRGLGCNYVISNREASRIHCVIEKDPNNNIWTLKDQSSNGTFVNGVHYVKTQSNELKNGDQISISKFEYRYVYIPSHISSSPTPTTSEGLSDEQLSLIADSLLNQVKETQKRSVDSEIETKNKRQKLDAEDEEESPLHDELTCSICSELFIKAVTISCSHTFCKYCIETWRKTKSICPICRVKITNITPTRVLDNIIEKIIEDLPADQKATRQVIVAARTDTPKSASNGPSTSRNRRVEVDIHVQLPRNHFIDMNDETISSDDDDSMDDSDLDEYEDMFDEGDMGYDIFDEDDYNGLPGVYYGGYGRCFSCGERGHWANGCPNR